MQSQLDLLSQNYKQLVVQNSITYFITAEPFSLILISTGGLYPHLFKELIFLRDALRE